MARIVGNRIVPDEIITEQDTWRTNMNPQNTWGNYGINTLGQAPHPGLNQFPLAHAGVAGPEYLEEDVLNMNQNLDDTGIYTRQKGEPFLAENRGNILKNLFNPEVNWRGYQRGPNDFNINNLGITSLFQPNETMEAAIGDIRETGEFGGQRYDIDEARNKIYSEVNPFGKNLRSAFGSDDPTEQDEKTLSKALARLAKGKAISQRLRNILQNRGMLTPTGTDRIGGDPSIPIGPIDTGGYTRPQTYDYSPSQAARTTHWSERPDLSGSPVRGFVNPGKDSYGPWKAEGGRIGYANGEFVDEDINIQGPGFDVNENIEMASNPNPLAELNAFSLEIFKKPFDQLNDDERDILFEMMNDQAAGPQGEEVVEEGIASLV